MRYLALLYAFVSTSAGQVAAAASTISDGTLPQRIRTSSSRLSLDPVDIGVDPSSFKLDNHDDYLNTVSTINTTRFLNSLVPSSFGTVYTPPPARTVDALPIPTASYQHNDLKQRDEDEDPSDKDSLPSSPLPSLPDYGSELTEYLQSITEGLTKKNKWLDHKQADTFGTWFPFTDHKTAAGVTGLYGCTAVMIISREGVYAAHIYEDPVFITQGKFGNMIPTTESVFRKASFDALVNGDEDSASSASSSKSKPIKDLIGTDAAPGPLHHSLSGIGPLMYAKRIQWLSDQLHACIYPPGTKDNKPTAHAYKIASQKIAETPNAIPGKAIMESTPIHRYEVRGENDQLTAFGCWRLWVNGKEAADWEYVNEDVLCPVQCGVGEEEEGEQEDVEMVDVPEDDTGTGHENVATGFIELVV
ncbi:uncharacterized protein BDV14DRAFT_202914 [Aspergillus stella-maris]|uniref:uncharacterized protein n=1 Tax=Aspergillus stella-maris TaxID=1810926 RepID=UPI003CCD5C42